MTGYYSCMINDVFISLIRLSLETTTLLLDGVYLSPAPSDREWEQLYKLAIKQSLVGVCFAGVRKYTEICGPSTTKATIPEKIYLRWLASTTQIQRRNEIMNQRCVELQRNLHLSGFSCTILKGQGVASLYGPLKDFRQPGDIDIWCHKASIRQIVDYLKREGYAYHATAAHVKTELFDSISVEFHSYPSFFKCPWKNKRLKKWINSFDISSFNESLGFKIPSVEFNIIFLLIHMHHHVIHEGLGLRQLMDYYFLLVSNSETDDYTDSIKTIKSLGLKKFAGAVMWVLREVFALENSRMICLPNEQLGRLLLDEVLQGGNFGKYSLKQNGLREKNVIIRTYNNTRRRLQFFAMDPEEVICTPLWSIWHYLWRKTKGYI